MNHHEHILRRLLEGKPEPAKARIEQVLKEIKSAANDLPLQAQLDINSGIMDIEEALQNKSDD